MHDNFEKHIKQKAKSLPLIEHRDDLWSSIESEMDFSEKLNSRVKELPTYTHSPALWDSIQIKTDNNRKRLTLYYLSGIASSILLLFSIVQFSSHIKGYRKSYSLEIIENTAETLVADNMDDINTILQQFCSYSNINCNTPDFMRIKSELSRLETEIQKLNHVISNYGESDEIIKCLIRMENQKSDLINELLKS